MNLFKGLWEQQNANVEGGNKWGEALGTLATQGDFGREQRDPHCSKNEDPCSLDKFPHCQLTVFACI